MNTLLDLFPELNSKKGFMVIIDPDNFYLDFDHNREHKRYLDEKYLDEITASEKYMTSILVGGSTGVTEQSMDKIIIKIISNNRYLSEKIGLVPSSQVTFSKYARYAVFPFCINASDSYFHYDFLYQSIDFVNLNSIIPVPTAYLLTSPADKTTVGRVLQPNLITDTNSAKRYTQIVNLLGLQTLSLEAGSGAEYPVSLEIIKACRDNFNGLITVGGGIKKPKQAKQIVNAGADVIIIGDAIEKSRHPGELIRSIYNAIYD